MVYSLILLLPLASAALGISLLVIWLLFRLKLVSQDMVMRTGVPYYAESAGLVGRPDEVVRRGKYFVPVEHKSSASGGKAREWDVAQLLAYCLIVEENFGNVASGELVYRDCTFVIPWNNENRKYLMSLVSSMRGGSSSKTNKLWKCRNCEFRRYCGRD